MKKPQRTFCICTADQHARMWTGPDLERALKDFRLSLPPGESLDVVAVIEAHMVVMPVPGVPFSVMLTTNPKPPAPDAPS